MYTINALTMRMPLTLRHESLYAGPAWVMLGLVLAVAAFGLWLARAGEPLFGAQTDGRRPSLTRNFHERVTPVVPRASVGS